MKNKRAEIGAFGEEFTVKYLKKHGYKILERNFHSRFGEIDIIAAKKGIVAFVEVKTRSEDAIFYPREAVDYYKQQKCVKTAQLFLMQQSLECQPRFDVSEILVEKREDVKLSVKQHTYIENAFSE